MKKNMTMFLAAALGTLLVAGTAQAAVSVDANEESATGYTVSFTYENKNATNVQIVGGFEFALQDDERIYGGGYNLEEGDSAGNYYVAPEDWTKDAGLWHVSDGSYVRDLTAEDGVWTYTLDLPGGYYLYQYKVSYDNGENYQSIPDPENLADCNAFGAYQNRSQFFVPYDAEKQDEACDWTWASPAEDEAARGTMLHLSYPSVTGRNQFTEIYLPAGYDAAGEPYKTLYLSHGGGGEEGDWIYQGHAGNILDRLVAEGACEPFVIVTMNNTVFNWDYDQIFENTKDFLIPYIEAHYNVSKEAKDRGFAGLSMGGMTTSEMYYRDPELFGYFGVFSGASTAAFPVLDDYTAYKTPSIYVAAGFSDMALINNSYQTENDRTTVGFTDKLDELEIPYTGIYLVQGSHDWFTWPLIIKDYFANYLWK